MILKSSDYHKRLQKEFGLTQRQVESITVFPFKFVADAVRKKQDISIRLNDFLMFHIKNRHKKLYEANQANRNNEGVCLDGEPNGGTSEDSREEIGGMLQLPTEE